MSGKKRGRRFGQARKQTYETKKSYAYQNQSKYQTRKSRKD